MKSDIIPNFLDIFEKRIDEQRKKIKKELEKPKKERNKHLLKALLKDTKQMRKRINMAREHTAKKCPHCGGKL